MKNRIWIQLEISTDPQVNDERARLATTVLRKLGYCGPNQDVFFFDPGEGRYCVITNTAGEYLIMVDNGHWFNLDFLAS